jgi:predicted nucleic acid-binding protein
MLFIYLLEGNEIRRRRVEHLFAKSQDRGDSLFTSYLALGEVLAGALRPGDSGKALVIREVMDEMGFTPLPFNAGAVEPFAKLRGRHKVGIADAVHLACAASAGMDLFLTGDGDLQKLYVPGIQFIADYDNPLL